MLTINRVHCYAQATIAPFCIVPMSLAIDLVSSVLRQGLATSPSSRHIAVQAAHHGGLLQDPFNSRKRAMVDEVVVWLALGRRTEVPPYALQQQNNLP